MGPAEPPRDVLDRMIRESLRHPAHLRAFLEAAVPDLAPGFDCAQARLLDREFPLDDWRRREADLPFEIPYRQDQADVLTLVCVLVEHQSDTDPLLPLRLLYLAVTYWDRQWRQWEQTPRPRPAFRLRPVLPLVLYTGATAWGSHRTLRDLLGAPEGLHTFAPTWQPLFWNLSEQTPEQLLETGREWLQVLAVVRAQEESAEAFAGVFTEALRRLQAVHGQDPVRWYDLLRMALTWALYRRPRGEGPGLLAAARASQSGALAQEVQTMGQTIADALREEGMAKGMAQGMAKGMAQGELRATQRLLRRLLESRFGPLPEAVSQQIDSMTDRERLEAEVVRVPQLSSLDELHL